MMPNFDIKKMQKLVKKMDMNMQEIPAKEVIIKCEDKHIIISKPEVLLADFLGKDVYQVSGEVAEATPLKESDIEMVMDKTGKDRETVVGKLEELDNDLAKAIMELKKRD